MRTWSYITAEPRRSDILRKLGVSEAAINLGIEGQWPHPAFQIVCVEPHRSSDNQEAPGPVIVGVYESSGGSCYGLRPSETGVEYVAFSAEELGEIDVVGKGETALWIELFVNMVSSQEYDEDELLEAADAVGFALLADVTQYFAGGMTEPLEAFIARLTVERD